MFQHILQLLFLVLECAWSQFELFEVELVQLRRSIVSERLFMIYEFPLGLSVFKPNDSLELDRL